MYFQGSPLLAVLGVCALSACVSDQSRIDALQTAVDQRLVETGDAHFVAARPAAPAKDFRAALRQAVEADDAFHAARYTEAEAIAGIGIATSGTRPQLTGSALGGQVREGSPSNQTIGGAAIDVMLNQIVYDGGATRAAIDEATARAIAARANTLETGNTVALDVFTAWTNLWLAREQIALLRARTAEFTTIMGQLDKMTESGMIDSSMREGARLAQIDFQMEDSRLQSELAAAEATFLRYFRSAPAPLARPAALFSDAELASAAAAWQASPALRRAAAELVAAEATAAGARAALKPVISVNAGVQSPMDPNDTTDTSVGLQLRYTFHDGGKRQAQIKAADARQNALTSQLSDAQAQAQAQAKASVAQLAALAESSGLIAEKVTASAGKADTAAAQITLGQSTLSALLDAQIGNYRATEQQLKLTADKLIVQAQIAAGTGQLLARLGIED